MVWAALACSGLAAGDTSVGWRGDGTGVYPDAQPPAKWSATENVAWQTPMPGRCYGAPIVVGDCVFTCSEPSTLLSVSAADGTIWCSGTHTPSRPPLYELTDPPIVCNFSLIGWHGLTEGATLRVAMRPGGFWH